MRKKIFLVLSLVLIIALMAIPVSAAKPVAGPARIVDTVSASVTPADHQAAVLMAGKDMPVGYVYINACAEPDTYEVRYEVTEPGWFLTEIHFEAINEGDDVFIENNGTLIPGKFTAKDVFELATEVTEYSFKYKSGAEVLEFAAHAVVEMTECVVNAIAPYIGDTATAEQGLRKDLTPVLPERSTPENGLADDSVFFSLGFGGSLVVMFNNPITNGPDMDLRIIEITGGTYPLETAEVSASNDGVNWIPLGIANNLNISGIETISEFDLGLMESAMYIRILDTSEVSLFTSNADGFDVDAVVALHDNMTCTEYKESAWGAGVDAGTKNWAMVIPKEDIGPYLLLVETLQVPSTTRDGFTSKALESGEKYLIEATGTYKFANWSPNDAGLADAKYNCRVGAQIPDLTGMIDGVDYFINPDGTVWVDGYSAGYTNGLQVRIDGDWAFWDGNFNTEHRYTKDVVGSDSAVLFAIWDNVYTDNAGEIIVNIYKFVW